MWHELNRHEGARQPADSVADQQLAGTGQRADPCREIDRGPDQTLRRLGRLARMHADADPDRTGPGIAAGCRGRFEDRQASVDRGAGRGKTT